MRGLTQYKVVCKKCGGSDILKITRNNEVFYTNHTPIIAARYRPDMKFGFECMCGNDSRIAPEEKDNIPFLVKNADPKTIAEIANSLVPKNENKFVMEAI